MRLGIAFTCAHCYYDGKGGKFWEHGWKRMFGKEAWMDRIGRALLAVCAVAVCVCGTALPAGPTGKKKPAVKAVKAKLAKPKPAAKAKAKSVKIGGRGFAFLGDANSREYNVSLKLAPKQTGGRLPRFSLIFGYRDPSNHYRLDWGPASGAKARGRLSLHRVQKGRDCAVASAGSAAPGPGEPFRLEVRRRAFVLEVAEAGELRLTTTDSCFHEGRVALWSAAPGLRVAKRRVQPVAPINMTESFMRSGKDLGQWQPMRGKWRLFTVLESELRHPGRGARNMEPGRSANYFSLTGSSKDWALCVAQDSHSFWDHYRFGANLRSDGRPVGLAFYLADGKNFLLVRWRLASTRVSPQPLELVRVARGREQVLSRVAVPGAAGQWYRVEVLGVGHRVRVFVDHAQVLDVAASGPTSGRVALYAEGEGTPVFDDVSVRSWNEHQFDTSYSFSPAPSKDWIVEPIRGIGAAREVKRVRLIRKTASAGAQWLGDINWGRYRLSARVSVKGVDEWAGLACRRREGKGTLVLRCGSPKSAGAAGMQLVRLAQNGEQVLAAAPEKLQCRQTHEIVLDLATPGLAKAYLDGRLVLRTADPQPGRGMPGLVVRRAAGARFEDVRVSFRPEADDVSRIVERPLFVKDRYMAGWASEPRAWVRDAAGEKVLWHKSDFHGAFTLRAPVRAGACLYVCARKHDVKTGYEAAVSSGAKGLALVFKRAGKVIKHVPLGKEGAAAESRLVVNREGPYLWVRLNERELFSYRDSRPLPGYEIGLLPNGMSIQAVKVRQHHVADYLFDEAPADWHELGTWEVTNRFTCDPRWSWFSGTSWGGLATIWSKFAYEGDVTLEFYAGMRMATGRGRPYPRPGELNATVAATGRELGSGYSVVISGWDRLWTGRLSRILRLDKQVAFTRRELAPSNRERSPGRRPVRVEWDPGGRAIHGAWYYIKIRKLGRRVEAYFDNQLVMQYDDPKPLRGSRVAIWTQDNSIMVARVRISYGRKRVPRAEVTPLPVDGAARAAARPKSAVPAVSSSTHAGVYCGFEHGISGWEGVDEEQGAGLALDASTAGSGKRSLRLSNLNSGGSFGARVKVPGLDLLRVADLRFKYCLGPDVRVNLYLTVNGRACFIRLTGPRYSEEHIKCLGEFAGVKADGKWHEATFDLAPAARRAFPRATTLSCAELRFGNFHEGYLRAGVGGNPQGAAWRLDDLRVVSAGPRAAKFHWTDQPGAYAYSLSANAPADPGDALKGTQQLCSLSGIKSGLWYFNLKAKRKSGRWSPTVHLPVRVDGEPLKLASLEPADKAAWGGAVIRLRFAPFPAPAMDLPNARLTVNEKAVHFDPSAFRYDPARRTLELHLNPAKAAAGRVRPGELCDGEAVNFGLVMGKRTGEAQVIRWRYSFALAKDGVPPSPVALKDELALPGDFEAGDGTATGAKGDATWIFRDPIEPASGRYSLKVFNPRLAGPLNAVLLERRFHAGRYPVLSFDYRVKKVVHFDLFMRTGVGLRSLGVSDGEGGGTQLGSIPGIVADGRWHRAETNLREMIETQKSYRKEMYDVLRLHTADGGYRANAPGSFFHLDNIRLTPAVSGRAGVTLSWEAADLSGIAGYSYHWSAKPEETPDEKPEGSGTTRTFKALPEGTRHFHIRARDKAGNWGPAAHYRFLIDNTAPRCSAGGRGKPVAAAETPRIAITDSGGSGVDRSSIALEVKGETLRPNPFVSSYDVRSGALRWNWVLALGGARPAVPEGAMINFRVPPICDFAGNANTALAWQMRVSHKADRVPPTTPEVRSLSGEMLRFDGFTRLQAGWRPYPDGQKVRLTRERRSGRDFALLAKRLYRGPFGAQLRVNYDLRKHPYVRFDYRFSAGLRAHLAVKVNGRKYGATLTARPRRVAYMGQVRGVVADDRWRSVTIDLLKMIRSRQRGAGKLRVQWLGVGDDMGQSRSSARMHLDNFCIYGPTKTPPRMEVAAYDLTGIAGFGLAGDGRADTVPACRINGKLTRGKRGWVLAKAEVPPGKSFLHVRACDGAGNWGPPVHVPIHYAPPLPKKAREKAAQRAATPKRGKGPKHAKKAEPRKRGKKPAKAK